MPDLDIAEAALQDKRRELVGRAHACIHNMRLEIERTEKSLKFGEQFPQTLNPRFKADMDALNRLVGDVKKLNDALMVLRREEPKE